MPALQAIFQILNGVEVRKESDRPSRSVEEFVKHLVTEEAGGASTPQARDAAARYLGSLGLHFVCWLRHIQAHVYVSKSAIVEAGLRVVIVDALVDSAVRVWEGEGGKVSDQGVPIVR